MKVRQRLAAWWCPLVGLFVALAGPTLLILGLRSAAIRSHVGFPIAISITGAVLSVACAVQRRRLFPILVAAVVVGGTGFFAWGVTLGMRVPESGRVPKTGDVAPAFTLRDTRGVETSLGALLSDGAKLLVFFRGHW